MPKGFYSDYNNLNKIYSKVLSAKLQDYLGAIGNYIKKSPNITVRAFPK